MWYFPAILRPELSVFHSTLCIVSETSVSEENDKIEHVTIRHYVLGQSWQTPAKRQKYFRYIVEMS